MTTEDKNVKIQLKDVIQVKTEAKNLKFSLQSNFSPTKFQAQTVKIILIATISLLNICAVLAAVIKAFALD